MERTADEQARLVACLDFQKMRPHRILLGQPEGMPLFPDLGGGDGAMPVCYENCELDGQRGGSPGMPSTCYQPCMNQAPKS